MLPTVTAVRLTCRFGPGEDEGRGAAAANLLVAGVDVNAVHGEGLQVGDFHEIRLAPILHEEELSHLGLPVRPVPLQACGVAPRRPAAQGTVRHAEQVPTPPVRGSDGQMEGKRTGIR